MTHAPVSTEHDADRGLLAMEPPAVKPRAEERRAARKDARAAGPASGPWIAEGTGATPAVEPDAVTRALYRQMRNTPDRIPFSLEKALLDAKANLIDAWQVCQRDVYGLTLADPGAVRSAQVASVMRYVPFLCFSSFLSGLVLVVTAWDDKPRFAMLCWLAGLIAIAVRNIGAWWRGRSKVHTHASKATINAIAVHSLYFGGLWAAAIPFFFIGAEGAGAITIVAVSTGIIYGGLTILAAPLAALSYIGVVTLSAGLTLGAFGGPLVLPLLPVLICYSLISKIVVVNYTREARERVRNSEAVRQRDANMERLLGDFRSESGDWVWRIDGAGRLAEVAPGLAFALGRTVEELEGRRMATLLRAIKDRRARRMLAGLMRDPRAFRSIHVPLPGAVTHWCSLSGYVVQDANGFAGMRGIGSDVTEAYAEQDLIERRASTDALTGLANRFAFDAALRDALEDCTQRSERLAVHYLDLDGFKPINDTHGHAVGDGLLRTVAERLTDCVRDVDFVARLGGDEFAIIQRGVTCRHDAHRLAERVIETVSQPCTVGEVRINVGTSIGICLAEPDMAPDALVEAADIALYSAKARGRGVARIYSPSMQAESETRRQMARDLREAFDRRALTLHYQPIVEAGSGRTVAFEALLRWPDTPSGPVSPSVFLPLAEETGLMREIGDWIVVRACEDATHWRRHGCEAGVMINLSVMQLREAGLVDVVSAALRRTGLPAERLHVEISETALPEGPERNAMLHILTGVRALGVHVGLDDFGTGTTSLAMLRGGAFDQVKIDRTLIVAAQENEEDAAVASAIVALARSLKLRTIAEGIERASQRDWTHAAGCEWQQGFLFGAAGDATAALARLRSAKTHESAKAQDSAKAHEPVKTRAACPTDVAA
ncbi:MAG: EAL domain-containing protein [Pseudomonadota bacterium]